MVTVSLPVIGTSISPSDLVIIDTARFRRELSAGQFDPYVVQQPDSAQACRDK
jgi:hypothetical protein